MTSSAQDGRSTTSYLCTSDSQTVKSYDLLKPIVQIPVGALIHEVDLAWVRDTVRQPILAMPSHARLMAHNYSNVKKR